MKINVTFITVNNTRRTITVVANDIQEAIGKAQLEEDYSIFAEAEVMENKVYIVQCAHTGKMVANLYPGAAFEGDDGKIRAKEIVDSHNRFHPSKPWKVTEYSESEI